MVKREIKFRVWDKKEKILLYHGEDFENKIDKNGFSPHDLRYRGGNDYLYEDDEWYPARQICIPLDYFDEFQKRYAGKVILMQYTGLKDKNGVDIYEGDLMKIDYKEKTNKLWEVKMGQWIVGEDYYDTDSHEVYGWFMESQGKQSVIHGKVVGNIYENPELIKND